MDTLTGHPIDIPALLAHLRDHDRPLTLPRGGTLCWDDAELHHTAHASAPRLYPLLPLVPGLAAWQRARVLLGVLAASQAGLPDADRADLARLTAVLTRALPPGHVVTALLALRRLRANHKHTTRAILRFVLEHPHADALIAARRAALTDCFEHALGAATARGCARRAAAGDTGSDYLRRRLLRFLTDPATALPRVTALYGPPPGPGAVPADPPAPGTLDARDDRLAALLHAPAPDAAERLRRALRARLDDLHPHNP